MRASRALLTAFLLGLVACTVEEGPSGTQWPVTELTLVEDGRIDGHEHLFSSIWDVSVADDGTIAAIDQGLNAIQIFTPDGEALAELGREGEGPGEFMSLQRVGFWGDTVWAWDGNQNRYSVFGPDHSFVRVERRPVLGAVIHVFADGSLLAWHGLLGEVESVSRFWRDGRQAALVNVPNDHRIVYPDRRGTTNHPFATEPKFEVASDGDPFILAQLDTVGFYTLTAVQPSADTLYHRRYAFEPIPIPGDSAAWMMESRERGLSRRPQHLAHFRRVAEVASHYPPFNYLVVGKDGSTWLRTERTPERKTFRVADGEGEPLGTLSIDGRFRVLEAELPYVWVLERDELNVQSVVRYRVEGAS